MPKTKSTKENSALKPPVIVVTGHIDHGKSTLLDYIRKANVVEGEAGGITQHLSAYEVEHKDSHGSIRSITFLDTPGHESFSGMRTRGVSAADIAILVVSAEDGVKPQTVEALNSIKNQKIPFLVAITKIDKPTANVEKAKNELAEKEVYLEGYGGEIPVVSVSGKTGAGIPELLDTILLIAEVEELKGNPDKGAEGVVIESSLDQKRGASATLIVKDGTLRKGEFLMIEGAVSPVRIMENFLGKPVDEASLSKPVRLAGLSQLPKTGSLFKGFEKKKEAETAAQEFKVNSSVSEKEEFETIPEGELTAVVPIILKADTLGTLEALEKEVRKIKIENVVQKIIYKGAGSVGETDAKLASGSSGVIVLGFNVKAESKAKDLAERSGATIALFDIIYKLTEWLEEELKKRKPTREVEETTGRAKIQRIFSRQKDRQVIGGRVLSGTISSNGLLKIIRRDFEIGKAKIIELQSQKLPAKEVAEGKEFGMLADSKMEIAEGDVLESFVVVRK